MHKVKSQTHTAQWKYSYLQLNEDKLQRNAFKSPGMFYSCCLSVELILLSRLEFQSTTTISLWMGPGHLYLVIFSEVIKMSNMWGSIYWKRKLWSRDTVFFWKVFPPSAAWISQVGACHARAASPCMSADSETHRSLLLLITYRSNYLNCQRLKQSFP